MTYKELFRVVIKMFGLYLFFTNFNLLLLNPLISIITEPRLEYTFLFLLSSLALLLIVWIFILDTNIIIRLFKLEKEFEGKTISPALQPKQVLEIALIILGGFIFIQNISTFLSHTLLAFKTSVMAESLGMVTGKYSTSNSYLPWLSSFLNSLIGYLLVTNYRRVSKYLIK